ILAVGSIIAWGLEADRRTVGLLWTLRIGFTAGTAAVLAVLIRAMVRKDKAPDLLREVYRRPFERGGLCFAIVPSVHEGTCRISVFFQNRYDRPVRGVIALRPARGFWLN